jgi:hypothetical protein
MANRARGRFSILALIAFVTTFSAWAAETVVKYRESRTQFEFGISAARSSENAATFVFDVPPGVQLRDVYTDRRTLAVVGGVIFAQTAKPAIDLKIACPDLAIDPRRPNGGRLVAKFGTESVSGEIYDWEFIPVARFVDSGQAALFTDMARIKRAQYHDAFKNNLVGLNLFFIDNVGQLPDFTTAHLVIENDIPGYPHVQPTAESVSALNQLRPDLSFPPPINQTLFADRDVEFEFRPSGTKLEISGFPYWLLLHKDQDGSGRIVKELRNTELTRMANPVVVGSIYRQLRSGVDAP